MAARAAEWVPDERADRVASALALAWGLVLAVWLCRAFFAYPPDQVFANHEEIGYPARLVEFRDLLRSGYGSPQWATHFRLGLGSPYFGYYQPGFFYAASLVPWFVAEAYAVGVATIGFAWLGFASVFWLVRRHFGALSGVLAGSLLLLAVYSSTEIAVRGDLSEFAAMMLFAAALHLLSAWLTEGRARHAALLAATGAALIATHPAVALVGYPMLGLVLLGLLVGTRCRARVVGAGVALAFGVGMAGFYWAPVFFEWDLVSPQGAFTDYYHYTSHFVPPLALLGSYERNAVVPLTLGPVLPTLVLLNTLLAMAGRREFTRPQASVLALGLVGIAVCVFFMSSASEPIWQRVELLQRLQFPWRILSLLTVLGAVVGGAMLPWRDERRRAGSVAAVVLLSCWLSIPYTAHSLDPTLRIPQSVAELEATYFAPDVRDEWLPRGATQDADIELELPAAGEGAILESFERSQGVLRARVRSDRASHVLLPHYYFAAGWRATLAGRPVEIAQGRYGLMRVDLPAGAEGLLEVRFGATPMRRLGLGISALTALAGLACLAWRQRRLPRGNARAFGSALD